MNQCTKYFIAENLPAITTPQAINGRNFRTINSEIDGMTFRAEYRSSFNILEILELDNVEEFIITSNRADVTINNAVAYLDFVGDVTLSIFPSGLTPNLGITLNIQIFVASAEDLYMALQNPIYETIYIGPGIYPGFEVNRPLKIVGCGTSTIIIPAEEYTPAFNIDRFNTETSNVLSRAAGYSVEPWNTMALNEGEALNQRNDFIALNEICRSAPFECVNRYAQNLTAAGVNCTNGPLRCGPGGVPILPGYSSNRSNNSRVCKSNVKSAEIIRVSSNNVVLEDFSVIALNSTFNFLIGISVASRDVNTKILNVEIRRIMMSLNNGENEVIGMYFGRVENFTLENNYVFLYGNENFKASITLCRVENAKNFGFLANAKIFLGGCGCDNQVDYISNITIFEDIVAFEGDGGTLKYANLEFGDIAGATELIVRDESNNFSELGVFVPETPELAAFYYDARMNYVILISRNTLR